jgi:carboxyl-terminal processing protease
MQNRFKRNALRGLMASSILASGFLCGFNVSLIRTAREGGSAAVRPAALLSRVFRPDTASASSSGDSLVPTDAYQRVLGIIKRTYAGGGGAPTTDLTTKKLTYAAIDGMLATVGDRYTEFWTPQEYDDNMQETTGNFVGIGASLDVTPDKKIVIIEPIDGSPAARAGIQAGDIVTHVNGRAIIGQDLQAVIASIRGAENTYVKLTVQRNGRPILFNLKRSVVHSPVVEWRMADPVRKIGYIQLGMFNEQADVQFDAALAKLERQGMKALIFDLRDNPGGLLQVAQDLASRFVESGAIVWVKEKNGRMSPLNVEPEKHRSPLYKGEYPVAVLVNGGSASAAEIVAGAIQDSGAGLLLGNRTYGKGLVQTIMPLADKSAVKITTQHYFTRDKHDINIKRDDAGRPLTNSGGIAPDVPVDFTDKDFAAQRESVRRDPRNKAAADRLDPQMRRALEVLAKELLEG